MMFVIAVGHKQPDWVNAAFDDYAGRLAADYKITLKEIKAEPRTTGKTAAAMKLAEAQRIEAALPHDVIRIALDERGKSLSTEEFSNFIEKLRAQGSDLAFIIGGPDGLDDDLKRRCAHQIRFSSMTLPHGLVRVMLAEALYRAWSLANHHPYHRA